MNHPRIILVARLGFILAFAPLSSARASSGSARVDVVVDVTEAGEKVAPPTPEKPAYYFPLTVGYKQMGGNVAAQPPPPPTAEVQHLLATALFSQGYRFVTKQTTPSLIFVFWWGVMAPESVEMQSFDSFQGGRVPGMGLSSTGAMGSSMLAMGSMDTNQEQMLVLTRGDKPMDETNPFDPRVREALDVAKQPRYYLMISAFDFKSWQAHKPVLLWRAHVSADLLENDFSAVLPALVTTAAPMFGRDTNGPHFVDASLVASGRVLVGTPVVKPNPGAPPRDHP